MVLALQRMVISPKFYAQNLLKRYVCVSAVLQMKIEPLLYILFLYFCLPRALQTYAEIEIPLDIDIPQDDADIDAGEAEANKREEQKWNELDLDIFRP